MSSVSLRLNGGGIPVEQERHRVPAPARRLGDKETLAVRGHAVLVDFPGWIEVHLEERLRRARPDGIVRWDVDSHQSPPGREVVELAAVASPERLHAAAARELPL